MIPPSRDDLHEIPLPDLRASARAAIPGLLVVVAVVGVLGYVAREPLHTWSTAFVHQAGLAGVFLAGAALDAVPGVGAQPILFVGYAGGLGFLPVLAVGGAAGVAAGGLGWLTGRVLSRSRRAMDWLFRSGLAALLLRHRTRAVFIGAILPFPYALTTIAAGAVGVSLRETLLGALGRYPKALLNLALIAGGWSLGG